MNDCLKTCSKCGLLLPVIAFAKGRNQCKGCIKASQKTYRQSDKYKASKKAYQQSDEYKAYQQYDKYKASQKSRRQSDEYKALQKAYQQSDKYKSSQKSRRQSKSYFAKLLSGCCGIPKEDIPQDLIELHRAQILLQRRDYDMNTTALREQLEGVMNGLLNGSLDTSTAHEISNAAGKFVSTIKVDLMGEALKHQIAGYTHESLTLHTTPIDTKPIEAQTIK